MFFILSKLFYFLVTPVFWILLFAIVSLILKNPKVKKWFLVLAVLFLLFFTNDYIFNHICRKWEVPIKSANEIKVKYDYGIVLGGMASINTRTQKMKISESIDRILQAIILYRQGSIKKIVITGGSGLVFNQKDKEAFMLKNYCQKFGVDTTDIILEPNSRNTHENAVNTMKLINCKQHKVLLITSAFHMRRSMGCFKKEGFKFEVYPVDTYEFSYLGPDDYFMPNPEPLEKWGSFIKEWIGYAVYKVIGYI